MSRNSHPLLVMAFLSPWAAISPGCSGGGGGGAPASPVVVIMSPTVDPTYRINRSAIVLQGTAAAASSVAHVTWQNTATSGSGTATGTNAWSASIPLTFGNNPITVTARDATGLEGTDSLTVNCFGGALLSPTSLTFQATHGGSAPPGQTLDLTFGLSGTLSWIATTDKPWLKVTPSSGTTTAETDTLTVSVVLQQSEAWIGPTSMTNVPGIRNGHVAVWTGLQMFVPWGWNAGPDNQFYYHDSAGDTWTGPTTSLGSCPVRWRATGVWTGQEVVVWGGLENASGGNVNTGYRYNPLANTWSWISSTNAPTARRGHSAIWTGTEMIVWGGGNAGINTNNGGRYNPVTDMWGTPPTTVGAPGIRGGHIAVWTGTEMIIWGGGDAAQYNSGARYDPVTDQWTGTLSTVGAPAGRNFFCAAWTGTEMIIWGGHDGSNYVNSGGRYAPATDSWLGATPTTGAPTPRDGVSGVWTGSEMVLFGGHNGSTPLNDGARYRPPIDLPAGTYTGTVTVSDIASTFPPVTVSVTLVITP